MGKLEIDDKWVQGDYHKKHALNLWKQQKEFVVGVLLTNNTEKLTAENDNKKPANSNEGYETDHRFSWHFQRIFSIFIVQNVKKHPKNKHDRKHAK